MAARGAEDAEAADIAGGTAAGLPIGCVGGAEGVGVVIGAVGLAEDIVGIAFHDYFINV